MIPSTKKRLAKEILIFFSAMLLIFIVYLFREYFVEQYKMALHWQMSLHGLGWEDVRYSESLKRLDNLSRIKAILAIVNLVILICVYPLRISYFIIKWAIKTLKAKA